MRVILDTNILIGALLTQGTPPEQLYTAWRDGRFDLLSCRTQLEEVREVTRRLAISVRIRASEAGHMVNSIRSLAQMVEQLPTVDVAPDPKDNFLLALAQVGGADYLVTGDQRDLLALLRYQNTRIVTARQFLNEVLGRT